MFIYSLYGNYGGRGAHFLWWLFSHSSLFRWLNRVEESEVDGYTQLKRLLGEDSVFGINMGSTGPDQKKSILGYDCRSGKEFFAKLAVTKRSMALTQNEINVYSELADTGLVPKIFNYKVEKNFVFLKCECIKGKHVYGDSYIRQVMDMLMTLKQRHFPQKENLTNLSFSKKPKDGLATCFAHMDFCPWNMIDAQGKLRVIDWELAAEMPLGFDLFTFLLQTYFLTNNLMKGEWVIEQNETLINEYFGMERLGWQPYLDAFIDYKIKFFSEGQNDLLLNRFKEMKEILG